MADLEQAMRLLGSLKKEPAQLNASDMVNYAASKTLDQMFARLQEPHVSLEEFKSAMRGIATMMAKEFEKMAAQVGSIDTESGTKQVLAAINSLTQSLDRMTNAVSAIKIPTPNVRIPEQKPPDLTPVLASNQNIAAMLQSMMAQERGEELPKETPKATPRSWTFDVKRNQSGLIRSVNVVEQ